MRAKQRSTKPWTSCVGITHKQPRGFRQEKSTTRSRPDSAVGTFQWRNGTQPRRCGSTGAAMRAMRSYRSAASAPEHTHGLAGVKKRSCAPAWKFWSFFLTASAADKPEPARQSTVKSSAQSTVESSAQSTVKSSAPEPTMAVPECIIEATEKGMVGENLLCSDIPSMEKAPAKSSEKPAVMTRAEEACQSPRKSHAELEGHVKIKGVDV